VPAKSAAQWNPSDLVRRVINALNIANQTVRALVEIDPATAKSEPAENGSNWFLRGKIVSETAMLLLCVDPIRNLDKRILEQAEKVTNLIIPYARHEEVLGAICLDPGLASDHAVAHILLSRLGYPDRDVDHLLSKSLAMGIDFGPERLPHSLLKQAWLARVWNVCKPPRRSDSQLLADSMLGRSMDALGATRMDIYAFTHAVMYASDFGERRTALPRPTAAIAADADTALAHSLDSNDFDLAAEVILTWPMLGFKWSPIATFAFLVLTNVEDRIGFLPGSTFDLNRYWALTGEERARFALVTSYHTAYVMGFLCAVALRPDCAPPVVVPSARSSRGAGAAILSLVNTGNPMPCWREPFAALSSRQQDSVAQLVLATLLRRARAAGDLGLVRDALKVALTHDLIDGPAPIQAAALLRRSQALKL